jgi:hypothetical protein
VTIDIDIVERVRAWDASQSEEQIRARLDVLRAARLGSGGHQPPAGPPYVLCAMEAEAYVAGEPWSDRPACACPVIGTFLREWNDSLPSDEERARWLGPLRGITVGTRSTREVEIRRSWMALDWLVREHAPAFLALTPKLREHADALRALPEITEVSIDGARPAIDAARAAARAAAGDAAWAAAWAAARDAAWDAARAAARDAAGDAAWAAARDAAGDAAWAAARDAAWDAAWDAARDALGPTVVRLQESAQDLVRRMAAVTTEGS